MKYLFGILLLFVCSTAFGAEWEGDQNDAEPVVAYGAYTTVAGVHLIAPLKVDSDGQVQ